MASSRDFANKIWNAARFLFLNMERSGVEPWVPESLEQFRPEADPGSAEAPMEDRWIFSRLNAAAEQVNRAIGQYRYHEAAQALWHFFWHEFCDWYVELKKLRFRENSGLDAGWRNMLAAFETALRLLHPAMPFLTEELWQRFAKGQPNRPVSIALAGYPRYREDLVDAEADREIGTIQEVVTMARTLRAQSKLDPKQRLEGVLYSRSPSLGIAQRRAQAIQKLANVNLKFKDEDAPLAPAILSVGGFDLVLELPQGQQDAQRKRLEKERDQLAKNIANSKRQLSDEAFLGKAPPQVVVSIRKKLADYEDQLRRVEGALGGQS
jgi:valyl-tRNA synthetase